MALARTSRRHLAKTAFALVPVFIAGNLTGTAWAAGEGNSLDKFLDERTTANARDEALPGGVLPSRRALQQAPGEALGFVGSFGSYITEDKVMATGDTCFISRTKTASLDCTTEGTGTTYQQVPACCDSASKTADNTCDTFDNAGSITCATSRQYPACCEYRSQPASVCDVSSSDITICIDDFPAFECCTDDDCIWDNSVLDSATGFGVCDSGTQLGCCPA